jgi:subtilisin-like proprotein convertase family protein
MKRFAIVAFALALNIVSGHAAVISWNSGFDNNGVVPDGAPTGWSDTRTVSGLGAGITDVKVTLNVSGGYNGDLYVYLAYNGGTAVLLNRVGRASGNAFGYGDSGLNVIFSDAAAQPTDIHLYQTVNGYSISSGTEWRPDARATDPATVLDTDARTQLLNGFNGMDPNGAWTLFAADMSGGGVSQIESWGLDISVSAVPEPVSAALTVFGVTVVGAAARRMITRRRTRAV